MLKHPTSMFLVLVANLFTMSCQGMTRTVAERCVLIDVVLEESKELVPLLDAFAEQHGLVADKSHPISPSYERRDGDTVSADLIYRIGMGRFGAELSLFRFDQSRDSDLIAAFDLLVEKQIEPNYKVSWCKDVPDYQILQVFR